MKVRNLLRGERSMRGMLIRERLTDFDRLLNRISSLERLIKQKVLESGSSLHEQRGISFIIAATILGETGHASRIHSESAFAMFNGTAPIQASFVGQEQSPSSEPQGEPSTQLRDTHGRSGALAHPRTKQSLHSEETSRREKLEGCDAMSQATHLELDLQAVDRRHRDHEICCLTDIGGLVNQQARAVRHRFLQADTPSR